VALIGKIFDYSVVEYCNAKQPNFCQKSNTHHSRSSSSSLLLLVGQFKILA
jgi:hypothetical protein